MQTAKPVWVVATLDTKSDEADYVCTLLEAAGLSGNVGRRLHVGQRASCAERVHIFLPEDIASHHPQGRSAVFTGDRGTAIAAMSDAFELLVKGS